MENCEHVEIINVSAVAMIVSFDWTFQNPQVC